MNVQLLWYPLLAQVTLTLLMYLRLARAKSRASAAGLVDAATRAYSEDAWPLDVRLINNNIRNQFESPVLFYVLVIALVSLGKLNLVILVTAWLYVICRAIHAMIHTGANDVPLRRRVFMVSVFLLGVLAVSTLTALPGMA